MLAPWQSPARVGLEAIRQSTGAGAEAAREAVEGTTEAVGFTTEGTEDTEVFFCPPSVSPSHQGGAVFNRPRWLRRLLDAVSGCPAVAKHRSLGGDEARRREEGGFTTEGTEDTEVFLFWDWARMRAPRALTDGRRGR